MLNLFFEQWPPTWLWPFSEESLPTWVAIAVLLGTVYATAFWGRKADVSRANAKKRDAVARTMSAILEYVEARDQSKKKEDQKMPEARRVFELLWDDVHEVRTTIYGIDPQSDQYKTTQQLLKRVLKEEFSKAMDFTRKAQTLAKDGNSKGIASTEDMSEIMEWWTGDKLHELVDFAKKKVEKRFGPGYVDEGQLKEAEALERQVRQGKRENLQKLWDLIRPVVPTIIFSSFLGAVGTVLQMIFHQIGYWMTPIEAAAKGNWDVAHTQLLRLFWGHVAVDAFFTMHDNFGMRAQNHLSQSLKNGLLRAIMQQDYEFFDRTSPGVLQDRLNRDCSEVNQNIIEFPNQIMRRLIRIFCGLLFCFQQAPFDMFMAAVAPLVPVVVLQWMLSKWFQKMHERERKLEEHANSSTSEVLREIKTVRQFAMESREAQNFASTADICTRVMESVQFRSREVGNFFGVSIYGGLIFTVWLGMHRIQSGEMTAAAVLDITFKMNFDVVFNLRSLIEIAPKAMRLLHPLGRICELLGSNPKIEPMLGEQKGLRPQRFTGKIEFEDVHFSYPKDPRKPILKGLTFTVEPGQKVALIGATGCGKSSTMSLLQRLYEPSKGTIFIDGKSIKEYDLGYLRSRIVIVDQFTVLFATTVRDNIIYGMEDATDEEVERACKEAAAWDFLQEKPDKLMTLVSSGGSNFSGGQRQRIAIARAIIRKPDVILLDEATASLDTENERLVQGALDKLARKGSALVIAHRLSTVRDSDKIVVVDHGQVVEQGTHEILLADENQEDVEGPLPKGQGHQSSLAPPPLSLAKAMTDEPGSMVPGPLSSLQRAASDEGKVGSPARQEGVSYKKLWNASQGTHAQMSMQQMQKRVGTLEAELASLQRKLKAMEGSATSLRKPLPSLSQRSRMTTTDVDFGLHSVAEDLGPAVEGGDAALTSGSMPPEPPSLQRFSSSGGVL